MTLSSKALEFCTESRTTKNPPAELDEAALPVSRLSLGRNFSWTLAGNIVFAGCQLLNLMVLAKFTNPAAVGLFALGLALTAPAFMLANLQLRSVQATDAAQSYRFGHYLALRLLTTGALLAAMPLIVWVAGYRGTTASVVLILTAGKACDAINDISFGLVQQRERLDRGARARMISGLVSLGGLTLGTILTRSVVWGAVGWSCGPLVALLTTRCWMGADVWYSAGEDGQRPRPVWDARPLRRLSWLALPLGLAMMFVSLNINLPRYVLESARGAHELGIYAAMLYLMQAGQLVTLALGQAVTPRLAHLYFEQDRAGFWTLLCRLLLLALSGGALGLLLSATIGRPLLALLYSPEYAQHLDVLLTLTVAAGLDFLNTFLGEAMTAARRFREQLPLFMVVAGATALASLVLIPRYGLLGAALATVTGATCQMLGAVFVVGLATRSLSGASQ